MGWEPRELKESVPENKNIFKILNLQFYIWSAASKLNNAV